MDRITPVRDVERYSHLKISLSASVFRDKWVPTVSGNISPDSAGPTPWTYITAVIPWPNLHCGSTNRPHDCRIPKHNQSCNAHNHQAPNSRQSVSPHHPFKHPRHGLSIFATKRQSHQLRRDLHRTSSDPLPTKGVRYLTGSRSHRQL
ncbi:hypothetical protein BD779DRAFT_306145 [Infundibulicybe gibba]|nr:hypothetical protein BD779DRAFT_306145 [Infundibulicybe gibba]